MHSKIDLKNKNKVYTKIHIILFFNSMHVRRFKEFNNNAFFGKLNILNTKTNKKKKNVECSSNSSSDKQLTVSCPIQIQDSWKNASKFCF